MIQMEQWHASKLTLFNYPLINICVELLWHQCTQHLCSVLSTQKRYWICYSIVSRQGMIKYGIAFFKIMDQLLIPNWRLTCSPFVTVLYRTLWKINIENYGLKGLSSPWLSLSAIPLWVSSIEQSSCFWQMLLRFTLHPSAVQKTS